MTPELPAGYSRVLLGGFPFTLCDTCRKLVLRLERDGEARFCECNTRVQAGRVVVTAPHPLDGHPGA